MRNLKELDRWLKQEFRSHQIYKIGDMIVVEVGSGDRAGLKHTMVQVEEKLRSDSGVANFFITDVTMNRDAYFAINASFYARY